MSFLSYRSLRVLPPFVLLILITSSLQADAKPPQSMKSNSTSIDNPLKRGAINRSELGIIVRIKDAPLKSMLSKGTGRSSKQINQLLKLTDTTIKPLLPNVIYKNTRYLKSSALHSNANYLNELQKVFIVKPSKNKNTEDILKQLRANPDVAYAYRDILVKPTQLPNDTFIDPSNSGTWKTGAWEQSYADLWGLQKIKAIEAWHAGECNENFLPKCQGDGVTVAVVDSGVDYNHPDLEENIWFNPSEIPENGIDDDDNGYIDDVMGWDFASDDNNPTDEDGHGTHVSGTIAAKSDNSEGISGVAPRSKIMAIRGLGPEGSPLVEVLLPAMLYAVNNGARVINNSWGASYDSPDKEIPEVQDFFRYAEEKEVVLVFAAGNDGENNTSTPIASIEPAISVASINHDNVLSNFSNYGNFVTVAAPGGGPGNSSDGGNNILSLMMSDSNSMDPYYLSFQVGQHYLRLRGTSMATPHVAGGIALLLARRPELGPKDVKSLISLTSSPENIVINDESPIRAFFHGGLLNLEKLVTNSDDLFYASIDDVRIHESTYTVRGSVFGDAFSEYSIYFGLGDKPSEWKELFHSDIPVSESSEFFSIPVGKLPIGEITIKLLAKADDGRVLDRRFNFDNDYVTITSPIQSTSSLDRKIPIRVTSRFPINIVKVESAIGFHPSSWGSSGISLLTERIAPGQENVDLVIATYSPDKENLNSDFVSFKITLATEYGENTLTSSLVYLDSQLKAGYPANLPLRDTKSVEYKETKLLISDLEGDGKSEIIRLQYEKWDSIKRTYYQESSLEVFDMSGNLIWHTELPAAYQWADYNSPIAIGDTDGDGKKEIFIALESEFQEVEYKDENIFITYEAYINLFVVDHQGRQLTGNWPLKRAKSRVGEEVYAFMLSDLDRDGKEEVITSYLHYSDGFDNPTIVEIRDGKGDIKHTKRFEQIEDKYQERNYNNPLMIPANLDSDSEYELVVVAYGKELHALDLKDQALPGWPYLSEFPIRNGLAAGDLHPSQFDEVSFFAVDPDTRDRESMSIMGKLVILNNQAMPLTLNTDTWLPLSLLREARLTPVDMNDDGLLELAYFDGGNESINVYSGDGTPYPGWPLSLSKVPELEHIYDYIWSGLHIADVDGDSSPEFLVVFGEFETHSSFEDEVGGIFAFNTKAELLDLNTGSPILKSFVLPYYDPNIFIGDYNGDGNTDLVGISLKGPYLLDSDNYFVRIDSNQPVSFWELGKKFRFDKAYCNQSYCSESISYYGGSIHLPGDSNMDRCFDSRDLVKVFQEGNYELNAPASFYQGDWDYDGDFDSSDLVEAYAKNNFETCH